MRNFSYILLLFLCSCLQDPDVLRPKSDFKTKNVFIVVMDGARYTETWGSPMQTNIPHIRSLAQQGVMCTSFGMPDKQ